MNRIEAAANAISESSGMRFDGFWSRVEDLEPEDREYALAEAKAAINAADEPVRELIKRAESRHGRLYCHVTTYELRLALGMDVTNWPNVGDLA